jgi:hypothetical protein
METEDVSEYSKDVLNTLLSLMIICNVDLLNFGFSD